MLNMIKKRWVTLKGILVDQVFDLFPEEVKRSTLYPNYYEYLLELKTALPYLKGKKETKILDVGAGGGVIPLVLRKMGYDVCAIDTWEEYSRIYSNRMGMKEDIAERLEGNGVQIKYCNIEEESFPFGDCSFSIVFFLDVIEHLHSSPKKVLKEINRVLTPNGVLILTTPNLATLKNRLYMLFGRSNYVNLSYWFNSEPFFSHVREYTMDEVKGMLVWTGFDVKHAELSNCLEILTIKNLKLNPYTLVMPLYLLVTTLIPKLRYMMIVVGQKS